MYILLYYTLASNIDFFAVLNSDKAIQTSLQAATKTTMHACKLQENHHQHKNKSRRKH